MLNLEVDLNTQRIKEKLQKLKKVDKKFSIFGSTGHKYQRHLVKVDEIEKFEQKFKFTLPQNFRSFLMEIGYGAGPYYGVWGLKEIETELSAEIDDFRKEHNKLVSPANNFPLTQKDLELMNERFNKDNKIIYKSSTYPIDGNITISSHGCQGYSTLVTKGEFEGTVWDLYYEGDFDGQWSPAKPAICLQTSNGKIRSDKYKSKHFPEIEISNYPLEPVNFLDWFENWLDNSLLAFTQLDKYNSFRLFNRLKSI